MKKLIPVLVVLAMVCGCDRLGVFSPKAKMVIDFACDPSDAQKAEATKWLTALDSIQAGVSVAFPVLATIKASSAMVVLAAGGCYVLDQVEAALVLLADMQSKAAATKGLMTAAKTSEQQFPVLWATVKAGKVNKLLVK